MPFYATVAEARAWQLVPICRPATSLVIGSLLFLLALFLFLATFRLFLGTYLILFPLCVHLRLQCARLCASQLFFASGRVSALFDALLLCFARLRTAFDLLFLVLGGSSFFVSLCALRAIFPRLSCCQYACASESLFLGRCL